MNKINENQKLNIVIICNSESISTWEYELIEKLQNSKFAKIIQFIVLSNNIQSSSKSLSFNAYKLFDSKFKISINALEQKNIQNLSFEKIILKLTNIDELKSNKILEQLSIQKFDLIISLTNQILPNEIISLSNYGAWKLIHGDFFSNYPPGFLEVINQYPTINSKIISFNKNTQKIILESFSAVDKFSVKRTMNSVYWKGCSMIFNTIKQLSFFGDDYLSNKKIFETFNENKNFKINLVTMLKSLYKKYDHYNKTSKNFSEQWLLMYNFEKEPSFSFENFKKLVPDSSRIWADPFVIFSDKKYFIFFEDMSILDQIGSISLITLDEDGNITKPQKILKKDYHLSYPFIFKFKNEYFMIPESSSRNQIDVYKCDEFPEKWKFYKTIMNNVNAVDTTLFFHKQKWWLFTGILENKGMSSWDEISLFYSEDPLSDNWISHPKNPIVSDVRKARSAGNIFEHNGSICRPSQNSSHGYGYGISINEILSISETEYLEKTIKKLSPNWDDEIFGLHTINHTNNLTIIDGKYRHRI